jgi:hypothetical protein
VAGGLATEFPQPLATLIMPYYATFGGCLRSDQLLFPELPLSSKRLSDWSLRVASEPSDGDAGELLGVWPETFCTIELYLKAEGFRLRHSCTGEFDITADGTEIVWYPCPGAKMEMGQIDVLGRVLSVALHAAGALTLHGSAVAFEQGVVAFLAPKHHGKSTLAAALIREGARLVSDDTVAVELGLPVLARSGVHSMRLCSDAAERLIGEARQRRLGVDGKHIVNHADPRSVMLGVAPLSAIYMLLPTSGNGVESPATRRRLPSTQAAISVLSHTKIGPLLGKSEAGKVFDRAVKLADRVPVYALEVVRGFDKLSEAVDTIMAWHTTAVPIVA